MGTIPEWERSPGGGHGNPLKYSCLENLHGQRSLVDYNPYGHKQLDVTDQTAQHMGLCFNPCFCVHVYVCVCLCVYMTVLCVSMLFLSACIFHVFCVHVLIFMLMVITYSYVYIYMHTYMYIMYICILYIILIYIYIYITGRPFKGFNMIRYSINLGWRFGEWEIAMSPKIFGYGIHFWQG